MHILITNDDGILAPGIYALIKEIRKKHEVTVAAPDVQKSASSHSITLTRPLTVKRHVFDEFSDVKAYCVDGTPADCVRLALDKLVDKKVDFVVSGINRGFNIGMDVLYSGTVSAAIEAAIYEIPSIAVSAEQYDKAEQYSVAARYGALILEKAIEMKMKNDVVLNVNVPPVKMEDVVGIKVCRMGNMVYGNYFVEKENTEAETGNRVYDVMGNIHEPEGEDMDTFYIRQGFVTLTPLHYDLTNFKIIRETETWFTK